MDVKEAAEREFWIWIYRLLLTMANAIKMRYEI